MDFADKNYDKRFLEDNLPSKTYFTLDLYQLGNNLSGH